MLIASHVEQTWQ